MTFSEITAALGIETYPEKMEEIYEEVKQGAAPLFDRALIDRHHQERELYGQYYEDVVRGYEDILTRPEAYAYAQVAARYMAQCTHVESRNITLPKADGTPALDFLPLFIELPLVDRAIAEYGQRGMDAEEADARITRTIRSDIAVNVRRYGRPGLDKVYFNWIALYLFTVIFPCGGFLFNINQTGRIYYVLRNKTDDRVAVLLDNQDIHRCGKILGSAGLTDAEGSFHICVTETEEGWSGYPADEKGLIHNECVFYPKSEWTLAVKPGDSTLSIHLPAGVRLDKELTRQAIADAFVHAKKYYSDYDVKALHGSSWILSPELEEAVGPDANIMAFISLFHLHPNKCAGKSVFNFVFKTSVNPDLNTLPEDTRLQRWLKAKYLAGGYHHNFGGFILP